MNRKLEDRLVDKMASSGFPLARRGSFLKRETGKMFYPRDELIFNRALDGKSSTFCVIATKEQDHSITMNFYNPDHSGTNLPREQVWRKINLPDDAGNSLVEAAVESVCECAGKKTGYYFVPHTHFGSVSRPYAISSGRTVKPGMVEYDDGISYLTDNVRKALFYHTDYYSLTCHNSFSSRAHEIVSFAAAHFGIIPVPGVELTLPMKEPNGPHILIWMKNTGVADHVKREILDKRQNLDMPAFYSGMNPREMLDILFRMQKSNSLALGIAHPVNFNSPQLPVYAVGLFSAVESGALSLEEAWHYARIFDSIAMWNPTLYAKASEMKFANSRLESYLRELNKKHVGNRRLWANQSNYSLAAELHESCGIHTHFETDEHMTMPFIRDEQGYVAGGDSFAHGMTVITGAPSKRPSLSEFIEGIRDHTLSMQGHVFAVLRKDAITVHRERAYIPDKLRQISKRAEYSLAMRYAGMLVRDAFGFLLGGDFEELGNMKGS